MGEENNSADGLLFDPEEIEEEWRKHWRDMPEFVQESIEPWKTLMVHFSSYGDMVLFAKLIEQTLTPQTRSVWYPSAEIDHYTDTRYIYRERLPAIKRVDSRVPGEYTDGLLFDPSVGIRYES